MWLFFQIEAEEIFGRYLSQHTDVKAICSDFLKHLLIFKPKDIVAEAENYFSTFEAAVELTSVSENNSGEKDDGTGNTLGHALTAIGPVFRGTAAVAVYHVYGRPHENPVTDL